MNKKQLLSLTSRDVRTCVDKLVRGRLIPSGSIGRILTLGVFPDEFVIQVHIETTRISAVYRLGEWEFVKEI